MSYDYDLEWHFVTAQPGWYVLTIADEAPHKVQRRAVVAWRIELIRYDKDDEDVRSYAVPVTMVPAGDEDGVQGPDGLIEGDGELFADVDQFRRAVLANRAEAVRILADHRASLVQPLEQKEPKQD